MTDIRRGFVVKNLLTAGAVSLLLAGQAAIAQGTGATGGDAANSGGEQGAEAEFTRDPSQLDVNNWQKEFSEVDENSDNNLEWDELESAYDEQLSEADWDREQVINEYDKNDDGAIDEAEYFLMLGGLQAEQSDYTAQQSQDQQNQAEQGQEQQREGQMASTENQQAQTEQSQGQQGAVATTDNDRNAMGHSEEQQGEQLSQQDQQQGQQQGQAQEQQSDELAAEQLQGRPIVNLEGEEIGEVEDVVRSQQGNEASIVVSTGGFLGMGGQEVLISTDELRIEQDQIVWQSSEGEDALQEMPEYNEEDYVSVR